MKISAADVISILEACAKTGVESLRFAGLQVNFKNANTFVHEFQEVAPGQQDAVTESVTEKDELAHKEEILARMMIEDPVAFEKALESGDLINSKVGEDTDEGHSGAEQAL
jgi:DNA repair photolyase